MADNASTDGSLNLIAAKLPGATLLIFARNAGFAAAVNAAAGRARASFLLLINPDIDMRPQCVRAVLERAEQLNANAILGGLSYFGDMRLNPCNAGHFPSLIGCLLIILGIRSRYSENRMRKCTDQLVRVDFVAGCFLLVRADLFRNLGGLDERFFLYSEDADFCRRAAAVGVPAFFHRGACYVHHGGILPRGNRFKARLLARGLVVYARRHLPQWQRPFISIILATWLIRRIVVSVVCPRRAKRSSPARGQTCHR